MGEIPVHFADLHCGSSDIEITVVKPRHGHNLPMFPVNENFVGFAEILNPEYRLVNGNPVICQQLDDALAGQPFKNIPFGTGVRIS